MSDEVRYYRLDSKAGIALFQNQITNLACQLTLSGLLPKFSISVGTWKIIGDLCFDSS